MNKKNINNMINKINFFLCYFIFFTKINGSDLNKIKTEQINKEKIKKFTALTDIKENDIHTAIERFKKNNFYPFFLPKHRKKMAALGLLSLVPLIKKQRPFYTALKTSIPLSFFGFYLCQVNQINNTFKEIIKEEKEAKEAYLAKVIKVTNQVIPCWDDSPYLIQKKKEYEEFLDRKEIRTKNPHTKEEQEIIENFYDTYLLSEKKLEYIGFEFDDSFFRKNLSVKEIDEELENKQLSDFYIEDEESYMATLKKTKELFIQKRDKLKEQNRPWLKEYYPNDRYFLSDYTKVAEILLGEKNPLYQLFYKTTFYKNIKEILAMYKNFNPLTVRNEETKERREISFSYEEMIEKRIKNIEYQKKIREDQILKEYYNKFAFIPFPVAFSFYAFQVNENSKKTSAEEELEKRRQYIWEEYLHKTDLTVEDYHSVPPLQEEKYQFITKNKEEIQDKEVLFFDSKILFKEVLDAIEEITKDKNKYEAFKKLIKTFTYVTTKSKYHYYFLSIILENTFENFNKLKNKEDTVLCAAFELAFNFYPDTCLEFKQLAHPYTHRYETRESSNHYSNFPYTTDGRILTFLEHIIFFGLSWNTCDEYEKVFLEIYPDQSLIYDDSLNKRKFNCRDEHCYRIHEKDYIQIRELFKFLKNITIFSTRDSFDEEKIDEKYIIKDEEKIDEKSIIKYDENKFNLSHSSRRPKYIKTSKRKLD